MKSSWVRRLRGLGVQVLLWTILPVIILFAIFSLTGIGAHQEAMHTLAAHESDRLAHVLAVAVSLTLDKVAAQRSVDANAVSASDLGLQDLFLSEGGELPVTLIDGSRRAVFSLDPGIRAGSALVWSEVVPGDSGVFFESGSGDVVAFTAVPRSNWTLLLREPWHSVTVPLIYFQQAMPFILLAAIIISLLALSSGILYVVRPLRTLGLEANRIGDGDFGAAARDVGGVKEIEDLREVINQMARRLEASQRALKEYLRAMTQAQEDERARLARELHDETVQTLIALDHKAQMIQRAVESKPTLAAERVTDLRKMTAAAIEETRRLTRALRPAYLEELGLVPALEMLARDLGADLQVSGEPDRLPAEQELALYRIAQEALNNARHHAQAERIVVEFGQDDGQIVLAIRDNGRGFNLPANLGEFTARGHFGLMGMRERAQLVGGKLNVTSTSNQGTQIIVSIPIRAI